MKASVDIRYGPPDLVQIADVEKPVPKDGEVFMRVRAASLNSADLHLISGTPYFHCITDVAKGPWMRHADVRVAKLLEYASRLDVRAVLSALGVFARTVWHGHRNGVGRMDCNTPWFNPAGMVRHVS